MTIKITTKQCPSPKAVVSIMKSSQWKTVWKDRRLSGLLNLWTWYFWTASWGKRQPDSPQFCTLRTKVFSWSGISRAVVSLASEIRKQNTPLLGFKHWNINLKKHINKYIHTQTKHMVFSFKIYNSLNLFKLIWQYYWIQQCVHRDTDFLWSWKTRTVEWIFCDW